MPLKKTGIILSSVFCPLLEITDVKPCGSKAGLTMADDNKQIVAHFSHSAGIDSILVEAQ